MRQLKIRQEDMRKECDKLVIFCKVEFLKNQRTKKKRSKTPKVPQEALPKSKSRSRSRKNIRVYW